MKICHKCKEEKGTDKFHKNKHASDGLNFWCKECRSLCAKDQIKSEARRERVRKHMDEPGVRHRYNVRNLRYRHNDPKKYAQRVKEYSERNPEKVEARRLLRNAIRRGEVKRTVCCVCSHPKVDAHHEDYSRPYDVLWLCKIHHSRIHADRIAALRK